MSVSHIKMLSNGYKNYIFRGFSHLQEQQEFVDLTLAADGHLVKVHKNIIALASPYLKEILKQAPSNNPVIFLTNVTHTQLCYLLKYIYQGEVSVPEDSMENFLLVAKALKIINVNVNEDNTTNTKDIQVNQVNEDEENNSYEEPQEEPTNTEIIPVADESFAAHITINSDHNFEVQHIQNLPQNYQENTTNSEIVVGTETALPTHMPNIEAQDNIEEMVVDSVLTDPSRILDTTNIQSENPSKYVPEQITLDKEAADALKSITQYSISERGSIQIIVSRYIYYSHHVSKRCHRWRCVDYRKLRCPAYIDCRDGIIIARKGLHTHTFHDSKIYKKLKKKLVFSSVKQALKARKKPIARAEEQVDLSDIELEIKASVIPTTE